MYLDPQPKDGVLHPLYSSKAALFILIQLGQSAEQFFTLYINNHHGIFSIFFFFDKQLYTEAAKGVRNNKPKK